MKKVILCTSLCMMSATLSMATEIDPHSWAHPHSSTNKDRPEGKLQQKESLKGPLLKTQGDVTHVQNLSDSGLLNLSKEVSTEDGFFSIEEKMNATYGAKDFKQASVYYVACALNTDMGETYQDTLYKINVKSLDWINKQDFKELVTLLPKLEEHLKSKDQREELAAKKTLPHNPSNSTHSASSFAHIK